MVVGSDFLFSTILWMSTARRFFLREKASKNQTIFPPDHRVLAQEIVEDLEPVLEQFREIADD
jgi:hypothetical protein